MNNIKLTKRNRDKYLTDFVKLEAEYLSLLKTQITNEILPNDFESYSKENFIFIWDVYKQSIKKPEDKFSHLSELPDIKMTCLSVCFSYFDWVRFRLWFSEESLELGLGLCFYLARVIQQFDSDYRWDSYTDDSCKNFLGKNHPILTNDRQSCSPLSLIMHWGSVYLKKDDYFINHENEILSETINDIIKK